MNGMGATALRTTIGRYSFTSCQEKWSFENGRRRCAPTQLAFILLLLGAIATSVHVLQTQQSLLHNMNLLSQLDTNQLHSYVRNEVLHEVEGGTVSDQKTADASSSEVLAKIRNERATGSYHREVSSVKRVDELPLSMGHRDKMPTLPAAQVRLTDEMRQHAINHARLALLARRKQKVKPPIIDYGDPNLARPANNGALNLTHPDCLVVYHIPKTGGLSLGEYLKNFTAAMGWRFHEWYSFYGRHRDAAIHTTPYPARNYSVVHIGHLTMQFEQETQTQHCARMTLLREPVDRVISAFYYHMHKESDWEDCLHHNCRLWWEYTNDMTRRFMNHGATWNSYVVNKYVQNDPLTQQSYVEAQENLKTFHFICFIENMRDCVLRMGQHYGVELDLPAKLVENVNKRRREVPDELKKRIAEHNSMDVSLYNWAKSKFNVTN